MPKLKSNRGAAKRFRMTKNGKVLYKKAFRSHILTSKSRKRKRHLRKTGVLSPAEKTRIKRMLSV